MDFCDSRYFQINKFLLSFLGLWPYQTLSMKYLNLSFSVFVVTTTLLPQIIYFLKYLNDLDEMLEVMPMMCAGFINLIKMISFIYNSKKFTVLLRLTQQDWDNLPNSEETQIITRYVEMSRKFTLVYLYSMLVYTPCFVWTPIAALVLDNISPLNETRPRKLLFPADYLVNQEKYYYVLLPSQFVSYVVYFLTSLTIDTTYFLLLAHICGMHAILCRRLEILKCHCLGWVDSYQSHENNGIGGRVRLCIQLDNRIREYIDTMEPALKINLLIDILAGSLFYICTCIMIVIQAGQFLKSLQLVAVALIQNCRLFVISWIGQQVINHSSNIPIAAYTALWYCMPIKVQKMLMLLIARSQRPSRIILAGIYVINLENFSLIMKTSISYCTVMISLRTTMENT